MHQSSRGRDSSVEPEQLRCARALASLAHARTNTHTLASAIVKCFVFFCFMSQKQNSAALSAAACLSVSGSCKQATCLLGSYVLGITGGPQLGSPRGCEHADRSFSSSRAFPDMPRWRHVPSRRGPGEPLLASGSSCVSLSSSSTASPYKSSGTAT